MATSLSSYLTAALTQLRFQRTPKRVRVDLDGVPMVDTVRAVLVWEPRRIVPSYAVPEADLLATLEPATNEARADHEGVRFGDGPAVLDPSVPFAVHTADGQPMSVRTGSGLREGSAFRLGDPDLPGYVILDFGAFDWREEDEPIVGHARDPFHRIDVRLSHRPVRIEHDGRVLAESSRAHLLFEGTFAFPRYYLPREDVVVPLAPGTLQTTCAYKVPGASGTTTSSRGR